MAQTIINIGNSQGVILPKEILDTLNIKKGDPVEIEVENGVVIKISKKGQKPVKAEVSPQLLEWLDGFNKRYKNALQELASK